MHPETPTVEEKLSWHFPRTFWIANIAELFERAAFYGMFIAMSLYLSEVVGFSDQAAGVVGAFFSAGIYLLPPFVGAAADRIGFRAALIIAFALLTAGYACFGAFPTKPMALLSLALVVVGGAVVKPTISGTAALCSDARHRARAFSIFYFMINIGSFSGKTLAKWLRTGVDLPHFGRLELGLPYVNYYAAFMSLVALVFIVFFYRNVDSQGTTRTARQVLDGMFKVFRNGRFICLILIVAGFWMIQGQMYSSMTKYVLRLVGREASPEWLANVNPLVVVLLVMPITHLVRHFKPVNAIAIAMMIIPLSSFIVASSPTLEARYGNQINLLGDVTIPPVPIVLIVGIAFQGLAECFLSPKYLEFASRQAPPGEEGLYMGYGHLTNLFGWCGGFLISGFLLDWYCPDPNVLSADRRALYDAAIAAGGALPAEYAHAHYIWYLFAALGVAAFCALLVFRAMTERIDRERALAARAAPGLSAD